VVEAEGLEARVFAALHTAPIRSAGAAPLPASLTGALDRTWSLIAPHLPKVG
jgi:hypothetical protein